MTQGSILFKGDDITTWPADVRGKSGMFLAFQYPQEIAGVSVINFLRQALSARKGIDLSVLRLRLSIMEWMQRLGMDSSFADRYLNEGFSGGEKKRNEVLQLAILEPELAILDETDSGLDIDALRIAAKGVNEVRPRPPLDGRVGDHALSALARRAGTRRRSHHDRRPHLHDRRSRVGRAARKRWLRKLAVMALDVGRIKRNSRFSTKRSMATRSSMSILPRPRKSHSAVMDAMTTYYETINANVHRGVYRIAEEATSQMEGARRAVRGVHRR